MVLILIVADPLVFLGKCLGAVNGHWMLEPPVEVELENICQASQRLTARRLTPMVVNTLEAVQIKKNDDKRLSGAYRTLNFVVDDSSEDAIICKAGQRILEHQKRTLLPWGYSLARLWMR